MRAALQFAAMAIGLAMAAPFVTERIATASAPVSPSARSAGPETEVAAAPPARLPTVSRPFVPNGQARIRVGPDGHFRAQAKLNYRAVAVLVDTGATSVALPRSVAETIGIRLRDSDFRHRARTANGEAPMAIATLDRIDLGAVTVRNVEAAILPDASLETVLLGMSFLGRLRRFSVENGELVLER